MSKGLYIHIPYCKRKCSYCALPSIENPSLIGIDEYIAALLREAQSRADCSRFSSLFIGGGTPSLLSAEQLKTLFSGILSSYSLEPDAEVSIELNPDTVDSELIEGLANSPVNRISLGAQSFDGAECLFLGRLHDPEHTRTVLGSLRAASFDNISLDLIAGFPGHSIESWRKTLDEACALEPEHIALYLYQREEGSKLDGEIRRAALQEVEEDEQADMYYWAKDYLERRGYGQYEISNFARPGYYCRHNVNYWLGGEYLGLGAAASSHEGGARYSNVVDPHRYIEIARDGGRLLADWEKLPKEAKWRENLMLRLRMLSPVELRELSPHPGEDVLTSVRQDLRDCRDQGLLEELGSSFLLSSKGLILANEVLARVI